MRPLRPVFALSVLSVVSFLAIAVLVTTQARRASAQAAAANGPVVVHLLTSKGEDAGTATFKESKNIPFGEHAVHIHANPVCDAPDFKGAGGHFNPDSKQHGFDNPMGHHAGDMPKNFSIGEDHTGEFTYKVDYLTLAPGAPNSVLGHSIVVHEKADDMKTDPTGNAGNRIACGVISAAAM
jgi:Cu-Zn family superoxide dismutase